MSPHQAEGPDRPAAVPAGYSQHGPRGSRNGARGGGRRPRPGLAQALWRQTERAIHQGLLPGYVIVEESSPVLRGRLRESAQLHRHHGLPLPLEIRHDEFTIDIPENQILRTACERMLSVPRVDAESQRMLRRLLRDFADVTPLSRGDPIPSWQPTRLNARYHAALRLAELVLRATSVEHGRERRRERLPARHAGAVRGLRHRRAARGARGRLTAAGWPIRTGTTSTRPAQVVLRPDIVWQIRGVSGRGHRRQVQGREARRLPERRPLPAARLLHRPRPARGHLVYARGNAEPARHVVRQSGIEIFCHAL